MKILDGTRGGRNVSDRVFSVAEVEKLVETGLLNPDERLELIGGELVHMAPKGIAHETIKALLLERWFQAKPSDMLIVPETTFRLNGYTFLEPDILVLRRSDGLQNLTGEKALLIVEIADTSFAYDTTRKAEIYAYHRVPELWVINTTNNIIRIHRRPSGPAKTPAVYESVRDLKPGERAVSMTIPQFDLSLPELLTAA